MPLVEYTGEVIPAEDKSFKKGSEGFTLGSADDLKERVGNDWWHLPAASAAGSAAIPAAKAVYNWYTNKSKPAAQRIEPTFAQPPAPAPSQTVMTASGPVNLEEVPKQMRPIVEKSAEITRQKMGGPLVPGDIPEIPTLGSHPIAPSATPIPAAAAAPVASPAGRALPAAAPVAPSPAAAIAPAVGEGTRVFKGAVPPEVMAKYQGMTGPGGNFLYNILGPEKYQDFLTKYNGAQAAGDYKTAQKLWQEAGQDYFKSFGPGIPREARMERGIPPANSGNFGKVGESGKASLAGVANTALNAAGGLMLLDMFKKAQQTGDYSDFAMGAIGQVLGNVAPRAAGVGFSLMQPNTVSSGTLDSPEAQALMRSREAGGGRGFVNPPMR